MMKMIEIEEPDLILVQEPYEYQNRPVGIEKRCRIFTTGNGKHRAAIVIPNKKIDAMLITQISNEDAVCLEIRHEKLKFFAVSMYLDIEEQIKNSFTKIDKILQFAKGARILIATDSNSRSKTWHDKITNTRGKKLEEYLASRYLHIINEQREKFTFHNNRGSSNIDLTITNNNLIADLQEWEISEEESCSDHNFLKYNIGKANSYKNKYNYTCIRHIVKEDKFYEYDRKLEQEIPKIFKHIIYKGRVEEMDMNLSTTAAKENDLERIVDLFTEAIQKACRETFKVINTQNKKKAEEISPLVDGQSYYYAEKD